MTNNYMPCTTKARDFADFIRESLTFSDLANCTGLRFLSAVEAIDDDAGRRLSCIEARNFAGSVCRPHSRFSTDVETTMLAPI